MHHPPPALAGLRPPKRPHVVVAYLADGPRATEHATKRAARLAGMALRRCGVPAFSFPSDVYANAPLGHDARVALEGAA